MRAEEAAADALLGDRFVDALTYAAQLHRGQRRKVTGVPYISHLLAVAALVIEDGGCEDGAIAALLHDAVEDQGGAATLAVIRERFGEQVAGWVWACTARPLKPGEDWRSHKRAYLAQVSAAPLAVQRIVLADKLHNGRSLLVNLSRFGPGVWAEFSGDREDVIWFYQEVCRGMGGCGWMAGLVREVSDRLAQTGSIADRNDGSPRTSPNR